MAAKILLILALTLIPHVNAADIINNPDGSVTIIISVEEMIECSQKGGCVLISVQDVQEIAKNAAMHMCGKSI